MSHSYREQTARDIRDSRQEQNDREATEILNELADLDDGAIIHREIDNDPTVRVQITSMDDRLAEILAAHDARGVDVQHPRRRASDREMGVTRTDLPAMLEIEPTWGQVLRRGLVDVISEVLP